MRRRRARFTTTARAHLLREEAWWLATAITPTSLRPSSTQLSTFSGFSLEPELPTPADVPGLRRCYLRRVDCHLYYTFDDGEVVIRALWGSRRPHGALGYGPAERFSRPHPSNPHIQGARASARAAIR